MDAIEEAGEPLLKSSVMKHSSTFASRGRAELTLFDSQNVDTLLQAFRYAFMVEGASAVSISLVDCSCRTSK